MLKSLFKNSFLICFIVLFNCASSYHSIIKYEPEQMAQAYNEDLSVRVGYQTLENNPRIQRRANKNGMVLLKVELDKKKINGEFNIEGMYLRLRDSSEISSLSADQFYEETKRYAWPFVFYGLIWFTISSSDCSGYECSESFIPIPIGLIPMLINVTAQNSSNARYLHDLKEFDLNQKSRNDGYVFFKNEYGKKEISFIIKYKIGETIKKITVPLSRN